MCILLKLDYGKFGVSNLFFFQKLLKNNLWGLARPPPPLVQEGLKHFLINLGKVYQSTMSLRSDKQWFTFKDGGSNNINQTD